MKSDFLSAVNEKSIYIHFNNSISGKNYETYYGLVRGNSNNQSKAIDNDGNSFFYIYSKTKFNEDILKSFIELTIKGIVDNKKTTNTQKKKRSRA